MKRTAMWVGMGLLMVFSLVLISCSQSGTAQETATGQTNGVTTATSTQPEAATGTQTHPVTQTSPTTETPQATQTQQSSASVETPKYGGTITLAGPTDQTNWDPVRNITGVIITNIYQQGWEGDWAKGIAGGYGTQDTDWGFGNNDIYAFKEGRIYDGWKWTIDSPNDVGTIVYHIRSGVHYHMPPDSEAGALVGGREVTADDVVYVLNRAVTIGSDGFIYRANKELHNASITKTGDHEVTVKVPVDALNNAISRFGDSVFFYPPELVKKYGDLQNWRDAIGTGPFMLTDYVPGSAATMIRNPNSYQVNPVGPGKGDQLPYVNELRYLIIPDPSTRWAALRTGKIDQYSPVLWEDATQIINSAPDIQQKVGTSYQGRGTPLLMRVDKAPFNNLKVRQALTMAIDFHGILNDLYDGVGQIITYPFSKVKEYQALYVGLDDPDFPAAAKELYSYNPEKAKQLLAEAGYPNGFKTEILLPSSDPVQIDYYTIIKNMWDQIGVDAELNVVEYGSFTNIINSHSEEAMAPWTTGPVSIFYVGNPVSGQSASNLGNINDPVINDTMAKVRLMAITDQAGAMTLFRDVAKQALSNAYAIPNVTGRWATLWWPWLKNYSGEITVGYDNQTWTTWVWVDQALKKSMGY